MLKWIFATHKFWIIPILLTASGCVKLADTAIAPAETGSCLETASGTATDGKPCPQSQVVSQPQTRGQSKHIGQQAEPEKGQRSVVQSPAPFAEKDSPPAPIDQVLPEVPEVTNVRDGSPYVASSWSFVGDQGFTGPNVYDAVVDVNSSGTPYVFFTNPDPPYRAVVKKYDGMMWTTVGLANFSAGNITSLDLKIDPNGTPYVAYTDFNSASRATVMKFDGTAWVNVGSPGFSPSATAWNSLAFDSAGAPHLAYRDANRGYRATVRKFTGTEWVTVGNAGFSSGSVNGTKLIIGPDDLPYVGFMENSATNAINEPSRITVMKFNGSTWSALGGIRFSEGYGSPPSLAFNAAGVIHVSFANGANENKACVMRFTGESWEYVGGRGFSAGGSNSTSLLAFDLTDSPLVLYDEQLVGQGQAKLRRFNGTSWESIGATSGGDGFSPGLAAGLTMAFASDGAVYACFYEPDEASQLTVMVLH